MQPASPAGSAAQAAPGTSVTAAKGGYLYPAVALAGVWIGVAFASIFAPDLVTGRGPSLEHQPLTAMSAWVWGVIASGLVLLASSKGTNAPQSAWQLFGIGTAAIWVIAGLVSVFAPVMDVGIQLPIAALIAPVFAMVLTAFLSVYQAGSCS